MARGNPEDFKPGRRIDRTQPLWLGPKYVNTPAWRPFYPWCQDSRVVDIIGQIDGSLLVHPSSPCSVRHMLWWRDARLATPGHHVDCYVIKKDDRGKPLHIVVHQHYDPGRGGYDEIFSYHLRGTNPYKM